MEFTVKLELTSDNISDASIDSLILQLNEVIAAAVEEKQIEIPDAEIYDYEVGRRYEW